LLFARKNAEKKQKNRAIGESIFILLLLLHLQNILFEIKNPIIIVL